MTDRPPDLDELVGSDLDPDERARLERVHELLVAAGPPPDLGSRSDAPVLASRRRRPALLALAAAFAAVAFAVGVGVSTLGDDTGPVRVVAMHGLGPTAAASASIAVFEIDDAGNWPMELEVSGLPPSQDGNPFELWLSRDGSPYALCGSFVTNADGSATVRMNAPYVLSEDAGWFVVEKGSSAWLLDTGG